MILKLELKGSNEMGVHQVKIKHKVKLKVCSQLKGLTRCANENGKY